MPNYLFNFDKGETKNFPPFYSPLLPLSDKSNLPTKFMTIKWLGRSICKLADILKMIPLLGLMIVDIQRYFAKMKQSNETEILIKLSVIRNDNEKFFRLENIKLFKESKDVRMTDKRQEMVERKENELLHESALPKQKDEQVEAAILTRDIIVRTAQQATYYLLTTQGFNVDLDDQLSTHGFKGVIQGSKNLRFTAAKVTKLFPNAISPQALKEQKHHNLSQYLTFQLKRFGHALDISGHISLPKGERVNLEGFCEAYTIPMITSSFEEFVKTSSLIAPEESQWIAEHFNKTTSSDYLEQTDIRRMASCIQDPNFVGPLSLGTGYDWHSTATIFYRNYVIYCNRGNGNGDTGIFIYTLPDRSCVTETVIEKMAKRQKMNRKDFFDYPQIVNDLGGKLVHFEKLPIQEVGNCTYVSMRTALFVFMAIKFLERLPSIFDKNGNMVEERDVNTWEQVFQQVKPIHEEWQKFDRELVAQNLIEDIQEWHTKGIDKDNLQVTYQEILNHLFRLSFSKPHIKELMTPATKGLMREFGIY